MEASIEFLLHWRGIRKAKNLEWVVKYIRMFNSYVHPGVVYNDLNSLNFCILNAEKTSKIKTDYVLPPNVVFDDPDSVPGLLMVTWK